MVSANNGTPIGFATVRDCPDPPSPQGCNPIDTLIELDVAALGSATTGSVVKGVRGQVVKQSGCSNPAPGYGSVFGVAAFEGKVFGFSRVPGEMLGYAIENREHRRHRMPDRGVPRLALVRRRDHHPGPGRAAAAQVTGLRTRCGGG